MLCPVTPLGCNTVFQEEQPRRRMAVLWRYHAQVMAEDEGAVGRLRIALRF